MGFLAGKRILITGLLSSKSIAYGIAKACRREGAELAFTYVGERFLERTTEFAQEFDASIVMPCDVGDDAQIAGVAKTLCERWGTLDGLVHSIGFAPREAIAGDFLDGMTRDNFRVTLDISAYSFPALAKAVAPLMEGRAGAMLTMTYLGSERAVPHYNSMGVAKAALEASVRYLAFDLGPKGIRVNGISAGPIKTLAASGIKGLSRMLEFNAQNAPLRRTVTIDEVGNVAAFLLSDLASGVTGEISYVDAGFRSIAFGLAAVKGE
jgi:enoyl-[acyl-carrier protein] reductase I